MSKKDMAKKTEVNTFEPIDKGEIIKGKKWSYV